jgi:hypothetical protein
MPKNRSSGKFGRALSLHNDFSQNCYQLIVFLLFVYRVFACMRIASLKQILQQCRKQVGLIPAFGESGAALGARLALPRRGVRSITKPSSAPERLP